MRYPFLAVILAILLPVGLVSADDKSGPAKEVKSEVYTPVELTPWIEWVKQRNPEWLCARNNNAFECGWPGNLHYKISATGAEFLLSVEMLREGPLELPSTAGLFPREIQVKRENGEAITAPLELSGGQLSIRLPRGKFEVRGSFVWSTLPPEIPAPGGYGLVGVELPADLQEMQARRGPQSLWLEKKEVNPTTESLNISVMRKISDGSPLTIETLLRIRISGRSRPLQISGALLAGSVPVSLESPIPAQLSAEGTIALQLLPGEYEVRALSLVQQPVTSLRVPQVSVEGWPNEEVWSWQPEMGFRSVELTGGQPLHADLTQLPQDWKGGAVYVMTPNSEMLLKETRRGEQSQAPNNITLNRELWIDLDGKGATVLDRFSGRLNKDFRINALPETKVGRATVDGQAALVTADPKNHASGVELRSQNLNMEVVSRLEDSRTMHATGWDFAADSLSMRLNLPPSWKLLHVGGAAEAMGSWVDTWSLLHIFVSILLILAAFKLFGVVVATILAVSLLLNHSEFLAPRMLYIHLMLLASWRLLTDSKGSIWRTLSQTLLAITFAGWALQSLAFAKLQFTEVLFPQLQAGTRYRTILQSIIAGLEDSLLAWPMFLLVMAVALLAIRSIVTSKTVGRAIFRVIAYGIGFVFLLMMLGSVYSGIMMRTAQYSMPASAPMVRGGSEYSDDRLGGAVEGYLEEQSSEVTAFGHVAGKRKSMPVQKATNSMFSYQGKNLLSGPAVPSWRWRSFQVSVAAPVGADHSVHFYLLSPELSRALSGLRAFLSLLLIALLFKALGYSTKGLKNLSTPVVSATALIVGLLVPSISSAETPSQEVLAQLQHELESRLCHQQECAVIESAEFTCSESRFKLHLEVSSNGLASVKIPGPIEVLSPDSVKVNGKPTVSMRRTDDSYLVVKTESGKNVIELEGALPDPQSFTVQFGQHPLFVSIQAPGWYVEGLTGTGAVQQNLRFISRSPKEAEAQVPTGSGVEGLHTWVRVQRNVTVGEQIALQTTVSRIGNTSREAHVKIPLLPGEQVTSGTVTIENNELLVSFAADEEGSEFSSIVPFASEVKLLAQPMERVSEEWIVSCQPIISCNIWGLLPTNSTMNNMRAFRWLPFPGESVSLRLQALTGLAGDFVTVDNLTHNVSWGANVLEGRLTASVRATQQTTFKLNAPGDAAIKEATLDGQAGRSSEKGSESSVLLTPGAHTIVLSYVKPWAPQLKEFVPEVSVSAPANNLTITVTPSRDRWLLWTGGLPWGPCVVFWAKMILIILICITLSRFALVPGSSASAILLGIGLTTLPLIAMVIPLVWLASLMLIPTLGAKLSFVPRWIRAVGFIALSVLSIAIWYHIVQTGLVLEPPMLVAGNGSSAYALNWYTDHVTGNLPSPYVISLPDWAWRTVALIWSIWLVVVLFGWLRRCVAIVRSDFVSKS